MAIKRDTVITGTVSGLIALIVMIVSSMTWLDGKVEDGAQEVLREVLTSEEWRIARDTRIQELVTAALNEDLRVKLAPLEADVQRHERLLNSVRFDRVPTNTDRYGVANENRRTRPEWDLPPGPPVPEASDP